jgi:hypothetical protein
MPRLQTGPETLGRPALSGGFGKRDIGEIVNPPRNRKGENGNPSPSDRRARFLSQQVPNPTFPPSLEIAQRARDFHSPTAAAAADLRLHFQCPDGRTQSYIFKWLDAFQQSDCSIQPRSSWEGLCWALLGAIVGRVRQKGKASDVVRCLQWKLSRRVRKDSYCRTR